MSGTPTTEKPGKVPSPLIEKFVTPLFFIAVGYAMGFFHGNSSGKKKQIGT